MIARKDDHFYNVYEEYEPSLSCTFNNKVNTILLDFFNDIINRKIDGKMFRRTKGTFRRK